MGFSVYDLLKEAEGDEEQVAAPAETPADAPADNPDDNAGGDDNFDIDADLDEPDNPDDNGGDEGGDDFADTGDSGGGTSDGESMEAEEDEPNDDNTDIFASLSAEEQQMKIMELKNQYNELYSSCEDLIEKICNLDVEEDSVDFISRINTCLFNLKHYIADYLVYTFCSHDYMQ